MVDFKGLSYHLKVFRLNNEHWRLAQKPRNTISAKYLSHCQSFKERLLLPLVSLAEVLKFCLTFLKDLMLKD